VEIRGLSLSARKHHALEVADFLVRALRSRQQLRSLSRVDVERFILIRSREVSRHTLQHTVGILRSFLRYVHHAGYISAPLDALDTPKTYRGELPPRALPWSAVRTLLAAIDRRSKAGWRDLCILHLMAYYGLRPSEVVALRLDSIDWVAGVLRVHQCKTRSDLLLPLAAPTLRILRDYLTHYRKSQGTTHGELFLRARCPSGHLEHYAVGDIFAKRAREAGLPSAKKHVYRLRHTFAMRLLTRGVGVKAIGDVLGHRSLESTCAYLRLDFKMLRDVALPVPRGSTHAGEGASHA
jgi:integrase